MTTPAARVVLAGRDITTELFGANGVLIALTITDSAGHKADTMELEVDNREGFKAPPKGADVQVWLGYDPEPVYMGRYKVDEWEKEGPPAKLMVSAKAADLTSEIRSPKSRSHHDTTIGALVKKVASAHGLTAIVSPSLAPLKVPHIDQQAESDLHFLSRLALRVGATFKLADGKVLFAKQGSATLPSGGSKPTITLTPDMVTKWRVKEGERGRNGKASAAWMDHEFGKRRVVSVGSDAPHHRDRRLYGSHDEARAAADGHLRKSKGGTKEFETTGPGMTDVFSEALVDAVGFDVDADGRYLVKTVKHSFTAAGFVTTIVMETKPESTASGSKNNAGDDTQADPDDG